MRSPIPLKHSLKTIMHILHNILGNTISSTIILYYVQLIMAIYTILSLLEVHPKQCTVVAMYCQCRYNSGIRCHYEFYL